MKTPFVRNQKVLETCLDPGAEFEGESATTIAYFIDENETDVMLYLDEGFLGLPEEFKALNLTCDGIAYKSEAEVEQEIPAEYCENVVLLEKREGKLFTCLGYEIELTEFDSKFLKDYESFGFGTIDEYISDCMYATLQPIEKELPYLIAADKSTINILENRIKADQERLSLYQARLKALEIKQATINK